MTEPAPAPAPRLLADFDAVLREAPGEARGALWRLAEEGRQLDANLVRLGPGEEVGAHREDALDVLLLVVAGTGSAAGTEVRPGSAVWLPRGATRGLRAGGRGLAYLTAHRRRAGLAITGRRAEPVAEGGEPACLLPLVCQECGRVSADTHPVFCSQCGERWPTG
ncbi:cupin domain-containing protein [Streptomyces sp. NPDC088923]|uniref:cupin domain-containing protein n=1 Tax=Streptomyces sp. NPDC088923 TaxID=3365913 RepID=UPI0038176615